MDEERLWESLGRIEAEIKGVCKKQDELKKDVTHKFDRLPCDKCTDEIKKKVGVAVLIPATLFILSLIGGAYVFTNETAKEIRTNANIAHGEIWKKLDKVEDKIHNHAVEKEAD